MMDDLWDVIGELGATMHRDRIASIAEAIGRLHSFAEYDKARIAFGSGGDQRWADQLISAWSSLPQVTPNEVAAALKGSAHAAALASAMGAIQLVWTGPKTGLIPIRHTEQVLLEVITSARADVFLVTYVFHKAVSVIEALNAAIGRSVDVRILLESSIEHGGTVKGDGVRAMREAVPGAHVYVWDSTARDCGQKALSASVHAKCAVADGRLAFITSANLTSAALERNMELGLLIRGGDIPSRLRAHLNALITTMVVQEQQM